jgi:DNA-binding transcriptional regulator LsrR (DeoR family)
MTTLEELRLMVKVSRLYYIDKMNQSQIARQLTLSQATVSRLLKRSEQEGIVRITVQSPSGVYDELEQQLERLYDIKEVVIADCANESHILTSLGSAAAHYLETTIKRGEIIGISSWSETLLAMVDSMHPINRSLETRVVQILGGIGNPAAEVYAARLTERLANLVKGEAVFLPAPGVTRSSEAQQLLLEEEYVANALSMFPDISLALVGIGSIEPSKLLASSGNIFAEYELETLRDTGAVGDICLRFFDASGQAIASNFNDRVIGMSLEQLRTIPRTIGIAGGKRKHKAILGALRGHWINILITDRLTAEWLITCEVSEK